MLRLTTGFQMVAQGLCFRIYPGSAGHPVPQATMGIYPCMLLATDQREARPAGCRTLSMHDDRVIPGDGDGRHYTAEPR